MKFMFIRRELGGTGTGCLFQFTYCEISPSLSLLKLFSSFPLTFTCKFLVVFCFNFFFKFLPRFPKKRRYFYCLDFDFFFENVRRVQFLACLWACFLFLIIFLISLLKQGRSQGFTVDFMLLSVLRRWFCCHFMYLPLFVGVLCCSLFW